MKILRPIPVLLVLLALAGAAEAQTPRPERPTWQVGDRWVRSDGAWDLVRIEDDQYVFVGSAGGEIRFTKNLAVVKSVRGQRGFTVEPPVDLQWPLKVGYVATSDVRWITWGCPANCTRRITLSVDKYETVTVPAGTFKAFKISWTSEPPNSLRQGSNMNHPAMWSSSIVMWYAPEIGRYVKSEVERDFGGRGSPGFTVVMLDVDRPAPLAIAVAGLAPDTRAEDATLPFSGKVTSDKGVRKVSITLNGAEVLKVDEAADPPKEVPLSASLSLRPGRNVVLVTATDASGETRQEARAILYEPASGVAVQRTPGQGPGPGHTGPGHPGPGPGHRPPGPPPTTAMAPPVRPPFAPGPAVPPAIAPLVSEPPEAASPRAIEGPRPLKPEPPALARPEPPRPEPPRAEPPPVVARPEPSEAEPAKPEAAKPVAVAAAAPFEVKISSPSDRLRVDQESIALAGIVTGGRGVSRVMVTLNGVEVVRQEEKTPLRALPLNLPIKLRAGQNTLVVTAIDADGLVQQDVRAVEYARPTPLAIGVRFPEDRARLAEESTMVAAVVTSGKGVAKVSVLLNGVEVAQQTERNPQTSLVVTAPITLRTGTNAIVISATDGAGVTQKDVRTVTYDPPKVAAVPAPAPPAAPPAPPRNQWAVVIGIGHYENPSIPRLKYTVSDAEAVYETLIGPGGFKKDNVLLLTDRTDRKPTLRNVKWALGTFLGRSAQKDDTVLIFYAGHGAPEVDTRGLERDGLAKYLIPSDADIDDLYSTALPMDELQTIFGRIEAERVVAFLDACYSGSVSGPGLGRTFAAKKTRAGAVDDLFLERLTRSKGRAIVTASRTSEVSIELPELGHGIFTYHLVQGLKGAADGNRDGIVSLQELYEYVEQQVTTKSRSVGGNQHPVMKGELEGALPLVKVAK
ncbi:MAG TPA: caspase family protein [Candidatus Binatia bacterium]|nr:caspase family protein [Candidatus Binatia bacterium]